MSFYTKYRPQSISELDLDSVRTSLSTILTSGKFAQVYLFSGPKGTGKTSSARILAKLLNCEKNKDKLQEPCNQCDSCRRITSGQSLTCLEMDAASNRGIDDIRQLRERIGLAPAEGRYTVYIIDEVHMLTSEAFNALLKTLEEPPAHAVFMLCTTDPQKIPDTVISRCMRVPFFKAVPKEILHSLHKAVKGENLQVETGALEALAERVDGSFRDGMKLLEQLSLSGKVISKTLVDEITGFSSAYDVEKFFQALLQFDLKTALSELKTKEQQGVDAFILAKRLVETVRTQLLAALSAQSANSAVLLSLASETDEAARKIKTSAVPYVSLEILAGEWCLASANNGGNTGIQVSVQRPPVKTEPVKPAVKMDPPPKIEPPPAPKSITPMSVPVELSAPADAFAGSLEDIAKQWPSILLAVRPHTPSLEASLRLARPVLYETGWLTIESTYKFHKEQLEQDRHRRKLEEVVAKVLGGAVNLKFTFKQKATDPAIENISANVNDDALVQAAEEIFGK